MKAKRTSSPLRIGPFRYPVAYVPRADIEGNDGRLWHSKSQILIADDMDAQASLHTLLHEVVHEIAIQAGQKVTEGLVDTIAYGWIQVIRDNPELLEMITDRELPR